MSTATHSVETEIYEPQPDKDYVLGFLFSADRKKVALIEHQKFKKLNGLGGHREPGELFSEAMVREFLEETGALVTEKDWREFCTMRGPGYRVSCFVAFGDRVLKTQTEGHVAWYALDFLQDNLDLMPIMDNLTWLIPMALDASVQWASVKNF